MSRQRQANGATKLEETPSRPSSPNFVSRQWRRVQHERGVRRLLALTILSGEILLIALALVVIVII